MQEALIRIVQMLNVIHSENMSIMTMLCGESANDIVNAYQKTFENACGETLETDTE